MDPDRHHRSSNRHHPTPSSSEILSSVNNYGQPEVWRQRRVTKTGRWRTLAVAACMLTLEGEPVDLEKVAPAACRGRVAAQCAATRN
jgi:hypothetical protein